ncbi:MAG: glycohydrolase toxin TNT-related protein [Gammaproteobacteria bacterium]
MSHGMIRFVATLFLACLSLMAQGVEVIIYYHNDALGSPIIATDQEGRVVWRKSYAPYGQPIGQTAPNEPGLELGNLALEAYDNVANPCGDCVRSSGVSLPGAGTLGKTVAKAADGIGNAARTVTNGKALTTFDPPNDGFLGKARDFTLTQGAEVDRFGFDGGRFLAPQGTPPPMRSLRPGTDNRPYTTFTVTKPLDVKVGEIAPAYGQPGLGTQFVTEKPVRDLIRDGFLEPSNR